MADSPEGLQRTEEFTKNPEKEVSEKIAGEIVLSDDPGATLRKWRENFGVSQSELSDYLGVSSSVISDYESGRRESPGIQVVKRTIKALLEIDRSRGGETLKRYKRVLGAGFEAEAIRDLRDYEAPIKLEEFYDSIDAQPIIREIGRNEIKGHTVINSIEAIKSFSNDEFTRLYGWSTERALIFTDVSRGESPLVAIRVTNLKPRAVVLHGIEEEDVSDLAPKLARRDGIDLSVTTKDLDEIIRQLSEE